MPDQTVIVKASTLDLATEKACGVPPVAALHYRRSGAALFIALSFLSLFSLLGVTYIRYMSLELEDGKRLIYKTQARHYAIAGLESAEGYLFDKIQQGTLPDPDRTFSYRVYRGTAGNAKKGPTVIDTHVAEANTTITAMDEKAWHTYFNNALPWPEGEKVYCLVSESTIRRADRVEMRVLGKYAVESVVLVDEQGCQTLSYRTLKPE